MPLHFTPYSKADILALTRVRKFETKLGEIIQCSSDSLKLEDAINKTSATYIVIGIPEYFGVKAHDGRGGADSS